MEKVKSIIEIPEQKLITRRDFMAGSAALTTGFFINKLGIKASAAGIAMPTGYAKFAGDFASQDDEAQKQDFTALRGLNQNGEVRVVMPANEQFYIADSKNNPIIYNYYKKCIEAKAQPNLSAAFIGIDNNQSNILAEIEYYLNDSLQHPNDKDKALELYRRINNDIMSGESIEEGKEAYEAPYDPNIKLKHVAIGETINEITRASWKNIPSCHAIRQLKPDQVGAYEAKNGLCPQVTQDRTGGSTVTSSENPKLGVLRPSYQTKGNYNTNELWYLNNYYKNLDVAKMILRSLKGVIEANIDGKWSSEYLTGPLGLNITSAELNSISKEIGLTLRRR